MASHSLGNRLCVAYPYAAGSLLYTWGAYSTMVASADALRQLEAQGAGKHVRDQAALPSQPVQLTPAAAQPEASACEAPSASRAMEYALFVEASDSLANQLRNQGAGCSSATQNGRVSTSLKTSQRARNSLEICRHFPALLISSLIRLPQQITDLQLSPCSAHSWASLDLTGKCITSCMLYPKHARVTTWTVLGQALPREPFHCLQMVWYRG